MSKKVFLRDFVHYNARWGFYNIHSNVTEEAREVGLRTSEEEGFTEFSDGERRLIIISKGILVIFVMPEGKAEAEIKRIVLPQEKDAEKVLDLPVLEDGKIAKIWIQ